MPSGFVFDIDGRQRGWKVLEHPFVAFRPSSQETRALFFESWLADLTLQKSYIHLILHEFLVFMGTLQAKVYIILSQTAFFFDFLHHSGWRTKKLLSFLTVVGVTWRPGSDHCGFPSQRHLGFSGNVFWGTANTQFFALCILPFFLPLEECRAGGTAAYPYIRDDESHGTRQLRAEDRRLGTFLT